MDLCRTCGLRQLIEVENMENKRTQHIRALLDEKKALVVSVAGAPGSGRTLLLERTLMGLDLRCAVIEGGAAPEIDAERLKGLCHQKCALAVKSEGPLSAEALESALERLPLDDLDLVFIEDGGTLSEVGAAHRWAHRRIALSDFAAGSQVPRKYPEIFEDADVIALTKVDLKSAIDFDEMEFWDDVTRLDPRARRMRLSSVNGDGLSFWIKMFYQWCDADGEALTRTDKENADND